MEDANTSTNENTTTLPNSIANRGQLAGVQQTHVWYSSNPFIAVIQGMVIGLLENSASILLIPLVAVIIGAVTALIPLFFSSLLSNTTTSIVAAVWLGLQMLVLLFALSLHLQLMIASFHQERISVHTAIDRALQRPLGFFGVTLVCMFVPILAFTLILRSSAVWQVLLGGGLLIPGYVIIARFWLAMFFFYDQKEDLRNSLIDSWQLTRGRSFEMIGVLAAQIPLCVVGVLSPLIASAGFTTRYFQLRHLKAQKLENSVRLHWANYVLAVTLLLASGYIVAWRSYSVIDNKKQICYLISSDQVSGLTQQVCQTKESCRQDPVCHSREVSNDPSIIIFD